MSAAMLAVVASSSLAMADTIVRHVDWLFECRDGAAGNLPVTRCAAHTASREGVSLAVLRRDGAYYLSIQAGPDTEFDLKQSLTLRTEEGGPRHVILPQQRRVAFFAGPEAEGIINEFSQAQTAVLRYADPHGAAHIVRFSLAGFGAARLAVQTAPETPTTTRAAPPGQTGNQGGGLFDDVVDEVGGAVGRATGWLGRLFR